MGFKNINKIKIEDTDDAIQAFTNTLLLFSSLAYDASQEKDIEKIRQYVVQTYNVSATILNTIEESIE